MTDKFKGAMLYAAAMAVLLYGSVAMLGHGMKGMEIAALMVWAVTYGGLLAGSAHYDGKAGKAVRP